MLLFRDHKGSRRRQSLPTHNTAVHPLLSLHHHLPGYFQIMLERNKAPASESGWDHQSSLWSEHSICYYDYCCRGRVGLHRGETDRWFFLPPKCCGSPTSVSVRTTWRTHWNSSPGPTPRVCDAIGQGLRICILNKFVGAAAGLGATYWEPLASHSLTALENHWDALYIPGCHQDSEVVWGVA